MVRKIDIKKLTSLAKLKELIDQVNTKADHYLFTENDRLLAILVSPTYLNTLIEKDSQELIVEVQEKERAKLKVLEFIKELRDYNKKADPNEIQADIEEAIRAVKRAELAEFNLQIS